jgi:beta-N-acetylhexosaminidase
MTAPGATILGISGPRLTKAEERMLTRADPWGFILFDRNIENADQLRWLTEALRTAVGRAAPVLIDQEGGRVARLRPPLAREWLAPLEQMARTGGDLRAMYLRHALTGIELRALGIDVNCAPIADIAGPETHAFLRNRCLGETAETVAHAARAAADGLLAAGVLPVIKHIPGHGRARADSHHNLPRVTEGADTLRGADFAPFRALADQPMAMTAHVLYEALDPVNPATTSPEIIAMIRKDIGFEGLLMSDDISMNALDGPVAARGAAALTAGCDVVLHCNGDLEEMAALTERAGRMNAAAEARAARALALRPGAPPDLDAGALAAEFDRLMARANGPRHG